MRASFHAVLLDPHNRVSPPSFGERALSLVVDSLARQGYVGWSDPIPRGYRPEPWEVVRVDVAVFGGWALYRLQGRRSPARWAHRLAIEVEPAPVALWLGADIDRIPGVGAVQRGGPEGAPTIKVYVGDTPWLKVGRAPDDEVGYPVPELVSERLPMVLRTLTKRLGPFAEPLERSLRAGLESRRLDAASVSKALGLPDAFPADCESLLLLHRESMLYLNASIS